MTKQITIGDVGSLTLSFSGSEFTAAEFRQYAIEEIDRLIAGIQVMDPDMFISETPATSGTRLRIDMTWVDVYSSSTCNYRYLYVPNLTRRIENFSALEINYRNGSRTFSCVIPRCHIESDSITISVIRDGRDLIPNPNSKWGQYFVELDR